MHILVLVVLWTHNINNINTAYYSILILTQHININTEVGISATYYPNIPSSTFSLYLITYCRFFFFLPFLLSPFPLLLLIFHSQGDLTFCTTNFIPQSESVAACMCECVCARVCVYAFINACIVCVSVSMHASMCTCVWTWVWECIHMLLYIIQTIAVCLVMFFRYNNSLYTVILCV